jgi:hypothetical protein
MKAEMSGSDEQVHAAKREYCKLANRCIECGGHLNLDLSDDRTGTCWSCQLTEFEARGGDFSSLR